MSKVDLKTASDEVDKWLDYKRLNDKKRESRKEQIETLLDAIADGNLILNEDNTITYKLAFPIEDQNGSPALTELKFKPRIASGDVDNYLKGIKPSDADGRLRAYISCLTGVSSGLIKKLDTVDTDVPQAIALFFL